MFVVLIPIHNTELKHKTVGYSATDSYKENKNLSISIVCPFYFNFALASLEFPATPVSEKAALPRAAFSWGERKKTNSVTCIFKVSRRKYFCL